MKFIKMLNRLIQNYKQSDFLVNVTKLGSATTLAQLITIATAPVLYRIYDKSDYGTLGLYMAITGITGVFSTLQYLQTILLEKEDEDALNAMWLNRGINIGFSLLTFLVLLIFWRPITSYIENEALIKWLWLVPISIFFSGQGEIFKVWANRKKEYTILTQNTMLSAIAVPTISISLGLLFKSEMGLFLGLLSGQSISAIFMVYRMQRNHDIGYVHFNRDRIKALIYKHKAFPLFSLPSEFVNRFTNQLPVFMLNAYAGPAVVGVYNLAIRMLGLPIQLIGGAISTVFSQESSRRFNNYGSYEELFLKTLKSLLVISIIPVLILMTYSVEIFTLFFGKEWKTAGIIASFMAPLFALRLINSSLSYGFYIHKLLKLDLLFTIILCIGSYLIFNQLLLAKYDYIHVLKIYTIFYIIIYIVMILINYKLSKK